MCLKMGKEAQLIFRQIDEVLYFTATFHLSQGWPYNIGVSSYFTSKNGLEKTNNADILTTEWDK
jgi:hypothetical protein